MKSVFITFLVIFQISTCTFELNAQYEYPFQDPNLDAESRIDNIIELMTLDEKINCLSTNPSVTRIKIEGTGHVEGLHGLAKGGPSNWGQINPAPATIFPQAIGLAETWDIDAMKRVAEIEAYEVRYMYQNENYTRGGLVVRAPNADIGRDPRWGRTEECFGEDAWFNAQMVVAFIKGLQGDHPKYWKTASLMKHFLANSNENDRVNSSSDFNERLFHEYYSYPFYKGITEGGSRAFMAAYNAYNGIPMTVHPVLKDVTVDEWGNNGIICTDGGAFKLLVSAHRYYPDLYIAAEGCIKSGINQFLDDYRLGVYGALAFGYITEQDIDSVIRGNFRVMINLGQLDPPEMVPYKTIGQPGEIEPWLTEKHKQAALDITRKSVVLLKNEDSTLPLKKENLKTVAVIGPWADTVLLDWYSGTPPYYVSLLEGIKNKLNGYGEVLFVQNNDDNRAVEAAQQADLAVVVVGNHTTCNAGWAQCPTPSDGKEAVDRQAINLEQEELIKVVNEANRNTVVVLISNFPYTINWTNENIPAIVHITHASQEQGNALADVLFGDYNPAGRLVQTWPKSIDQLPEMMDYDITKGRTYMYFDGETLYEFGYGLSYTTFRYSNLKLNKKSISADGEIEVSVDVVNTGKMAGDEVVQLYIQHLNSAVDRPNIELKGFKRITINPGETENVNITLKASDLAYWNVDMHDYVVEQDQIKIMVGSSSKKIKLTEKINVVQ